MLATGRALFSKLFNRNIGFASCSTKTVAPEASGGLKEIEEQEPVIPEDLEAGVAETEDVAMIRKVFPYNKNVLAQLKLDQYPYYVEREWWKKGNRMTFWASWRMLRDIRRRECLAEYGAERMRLKAIKWNTVLPQAVRDQASERLHDGLPRYSRPNLILNMCMFTGRRRGKIKRFRVNRHIFRRLADHGQLSGVQRAMW